MGRALTPRTMNTLRRFIFWDHVAEVYDTFGVPSDLIQLRLHSRGMVFTDEWFDVTLKHFVASRQGQKDKDWQKWDTHLAQVDLPASVSPRNEQP